MPDKDEEIFDTENDKLREDLGYRPPPPPSEKKEPKKGYRPPPPPVEKGGPEVQSGEEKENSD